MRLVLLLPALLMAPLVLADLHPSRHANHHLIARDSSYHTSGTYYDITPGDQGACGHALSPDKFTVALAQPLYGSLNAVSPHCGSVITVYAEGKRHTATVVDACPTANGNCGGNDLDMTKALFQFFAPLDAGKIPISWTWGDQTGAQQQQEAASSSSSSSASATPTTSQDSDAAAWRAHAASVSSSRAALASSASHASAQSAWRAHAASVSASQASAASAASAASYTSQSSVSAAQASSAHASHKAAYDTPEPATTIYASDSTPSASEAATTIYASEASASALASAKGANDDQATYKDVSDELETVTPSATATPSATSANAVEATYTEVPDSPPHVVESNGNVDRLATINEALVKIAQLAHH